MGETEQLAEFVTSTRLTDVENETKEHAKQAIRDYLGVALYGSHHEVGEKISTYVSAHSPGDTCTVIGRKTGSPSGAALANGTFGHAIDYDDTFESIVIHPTSPVFAATLAAAELADASGKEVLTGYITGCEVAFRIGHATYPGHYDHGWHSTGTIGTFGAAAAVASVLDTEPRTLRQAFGITASQSSALKKNFGSMTKPLHCGHAAQMGLRATLLAKNGFTADDAILEEDNGYGEIMTPDGSYDPEAITDELGNEWAVNEIVFKPYPSGVITHAAMEALRRITVSQDLEPADVDRISVTLDEAASDMLIHADAANALQAKFSIEFCLAAILRERDAGIHEFKDEYVSQEETREQMEKIVRTFEPGLFGENFAGYGARVVVETSDAEYTDEERKAPGSPSNPISDERLESKFRECAQTQLNERETDELSNVVGGLEDVKSIKELTSSLR